MPRTPRPELMALLADVKQNPDDLTPWLVLCDWLEEQDDEADRARGEYCRLCFDKLGQKTYASDWEKGERRRHLYRTYSEAWMGPLHVCDPKIEKGLWTIQSGAILSYVEELEADPEAWAWVGTLKLRHDMEEIMASEHDFGRLFSALSMLDIDSILDEAEVSRLASWSALGWVKVLKVHLPRLGGEQAESLVGSLHLKDLRRLVIDLSLPNFEAQNRERLDDAAARLEAEFGDRLVFIGG